MRKVFIGIDPGQSGAIAAVVESFPNYPYLISSTYLHWMKNAGTDSDVSAWLQDLVDSAEQTFCYIEKVHSMPKQGVASSFKFGESAGFLRGLVVALKIPFAYVTPQQWQKTMGCMSKGDKNVTKTAAQRLFPSEKITHANADALLLAEYCRRMWNA